MRFSTVFVGCAVLGLAGCGGAGGGTGSTPASKPSSSPTSVAGVAGQITQLGAGTLVVKQQGGDVSVAYSASTTVLQAGSATQANVLAGVCVVVNGDRGSSGVVTANMVQSQFNMNGNCTPPPGLGQASSGPGTAVTNLRGKVTSVSGSSFVMQPVNMGDTPITVNMPSTTRFTRLDTASTSKLAVGQCVRVSGQANASGVVQARSLVLSAPGPTGCASGTGGSQPRPSGSASPGA